MKVKKIYEQQLAEYIDRDVIQDCIERMKFYPEYVQRLKDFNLMFPLKKSVNGIYRSYEP